MACLGFSGLSLSNFAIGQDFGVRFLESSLEFTCGSPKSLSKVKAHSPFIDDLEPVAPLDAVAVLGTANNFGFRVKGANRKPEAVSKYFAISYPETDCGQT